MNTNPHQLPPFSPLAAPPVQPATPTPGNAFIDAVTGKKPRKANATVAKGPKKSRPTKEKGTARVSAAVAARRAEKETPAPAKRQRSARVAPLTMNAEQALAALAGLGRIELGTMQAIVALLNPLPRPARKRVLEAVASITSGGK